MRNSSRPEIMTAIVADAGILELFTDLQSISYGENYTYRALQVAEKCTTE